MADKDRAIIKAINFVICEKILSDTYAKEVSHKFCEYHSSCTPEDHTEDGFCRACSSRSR